MATSRPSAQCTVLLVLPTSPLPYLFLLLKHVTRQQLMELFSFHMHCCNLHIQLKHLAVYCLPINYTTRQCYEEQKHLDIFKFGGKWTELKNQKTKNPTS